MRQIIILAVLSVVLTGCATFKNTPQQDYTWAIGHICDARSPFWRMDSVNADGSSVVRGATASPPGWGDYQACLRAERARTPYGQWINEQAEPARATK
jgi:hypothetical protein